jgi:hypothetical protein
MPGLPPFIAVAIGNFIFILAIPVARIFVIFDRSWTDGVRGLKLNYKMIFVL